jgi:hypothetical protein
MIRWFCWKNRRIAGPIHRSQRHQADIAGASTCADKPSEWISLVPHRRRVGLGILGQKWFALLFRVLEEWLPSA